MFASVNWLTKVKFQEANTVNKLAKKSMIAKNKRPAKFSTQAYTRCEKCGRPHSVYRKFKLCRVCFRELAYKGQIPGVTKASW